MRPTLSRLVNSFPKLPITIGPSRIPFTAEHVSTPNESILLPRDAVKALLPSVMLDDGVPRIFEMVVSGNRVQGKNCYIEIPEENMQDIGLKNPSKVRLYVYKGCCPVTAEGSDADKSLKEVFLMLKRNKETMDALGSDGGSK